MKPLAVGFLLLQCFWTSSVCLFFALAGGGLKTGVSRKEDCYETWQKHRIADLECWSRADRSACCGSGRWGRRRAGVCRCRSAGRPALASVASSYRRWPRHRNPVGARPENTTVLSFRPNPHWTRARKFAILLTLLASSVNIHICNSRFRLLAFAAGAQCRLGLIVLVRQVHVVVEKLTKETTYNVKNSVETEITFRLWQQMSFWDCGRIGQGVSLLDGNRHWNYQLFSFSLSFPVNSKKKKKKSWMQKNSHLSCVKLHA